MTRSTSEAIRRGLELTIANWPLLLIRLAEQALAAIIAIAAAASFLVPLVVSLGLGKFNVSSLPDNPAELLWTIVTEHWLLLVFGFVAITIALGVIVAMHSFVQAGCADVYLEGERTTPPRVFTADRWWRGGVRGWARIFWIYNLAWLVASVVLLVPLALIAALYLATGSIIAAAILGIFWTFFAIAIAIMTSVWSLKAIAISIALNLSAREALRDARQRLATQLGTHAAVAFLLFVILVGGVAVISAASAVLTLIGRQGGAALFLPLQLTLSFVQTAWSAAAESWFLASFIALTESHA